MDDFPLKQCPKCGSGTAMMNQLIHGYGAFFINLTDGTLDCSDLHDNLIYRNVWGDVRCANCGESLFKVDDFLNVIE